MKKIGLLYLCTGPYSLFWEDYYQSFKENFLDGYEKFFFVFTDKIDSIKIYDSNHVKVVKIDALPWPLITLLRFNYFLSIENELKEMDYLLFSNANMICYDKILENEIIPRDEFNETLCFVQHPGHYKKRNYNMPYERSKKSLAYIPYNKGDKYVIGAFFCGKSNDFLKMCFTLKNRIEEDLKHNIIAVWHDESHLNRYIYGHKEFRILNPGFCYPVGFDIPFDKKIAGVSKSAKFDVESFKGTISKDKGVKYYYRKTIKKIMSNGFISFLRDSIMFKTIEIIE